MMFQLSGTTFPPQKSNLSAKDKREEDLELVWPSRS